MTKKKEQIKNKTWVKNSSKKLEKKGGGGGKWGWKKIIKIVKKRGKKS